MKKLLYHIILLGSLFFQFSAYSQSRIYYNNQELFLNGANFAWNNFARDIGPGFTDFNYFNSVFQDVSANGGNTMRLWLHTTGETTPEFDSNGMVMGPGNNAIEDLTQILDIAWEHKVGLILCLWSFDMLRISNGTTITDRSMSMLTDTAFTMAYVNNSLIPMIYALRGHPAIIAWEIFNEPEGMSNEFGWTFTLHVPMADVQRFVNLCAGAIHRTDPQAQVTNGCWSFLALTDVPTLNPSGITKDITKLTQNQRMAIEAEFEQKYRFKMKIEKIFQHIIESAALGMNYYRDDRLIAAGGDPDGTLDFYGVHYWNWMGVEISSFHHSGSYWNLEKPIVVGEFGMIEPFSPTDIPTEERYNRLFTLGYAGSLAWSWTDIQLSTPAQMLAGMLDIKTRYPDDVTLVFPSGTIESFTADPTLIEKGQSSLLSWTTVTGSIVTLNGQPVNEIDSVEVTPDSTTTYRLLATGQITDSSEVIVEVLLPGTIVYFLANPPEIAAGESTVLSWHTVPGSSVALNGVPVAYDDSLEVALNTDSTFTLITAGEVADTNSVTVTVLNPLVINRALNQPVFASSGEPNSDVADPALAVDGNRNTRWSSDWLNNQWIYVDLGKRFNIERVVLYWEVAYGRVYSIDVSDDTINWLQVFFETAGDGGIDDIVNLSSSGRYVRMNGISRATQWGFSLWEFEVYGTLLSTGFEDEKQNMVNNFNLNQNYPNPFNPLTNIEFSIPKSEFVVLKIYDTLGQEVESLVSDKLDAGSYSYNWDARNLASGVYLYRIEAGKFVKSRKMILIK